MDLGQIEAFVQVAHHHSFSKAAESLFLTQPSVTARIQSLERDLGETLFERNGRGVRLTEMGASFLPFARRSLPPYPTLLTLPSLPLSDSCGPVNVDCNFNGNTYAIYSKFSNFYSREAR